MLINERMGFVFGRCASCSMLTLASGSLARMHRLADWRCTTKAKDLKIDFLLWFVEFELWSLGSVQSMNECRNSDKDSVDTNETLSAQRNGNLEISTINDDADDVLVGQRHLIWHRNVCNCTSRIILSLFFSNLFQHSKQDRLAFSWEFMCVCVLCVRRIWISLDSFPWIIKKQPQTNFSTFDRFVYTPRCTETCASRKKKNQKHHNNNHFDGHIMQSCQRRQNLFNSPSTEDIKYEMARDRIV